MLNVEDNYSFIQTIEYNGPIATILCAWLCICLSLYILSQIQVGIGRYAEHAHI